MSRCTCDAHKSSHYFNGDGSYQGCVRCEKLQMEAEEMQLDKVMNEELYEQTGDSV